MFSRLNRLSAAGRRILGCRQLSAVRLGGKISYVKFEKNCKIRGMEAKREDNKGVLLINRPVSYRDPERQHRHINEILHRESWFANPQQSAQTAGYSIYYRSVR